jgi:uncharacterized protein with GYD domain
MPGKKKKITFIVPALSLVFQSLLTHPTLSAAPKTLLEEILKSNNMARYISLFNWTDQGIRNAKDTLNRANAARKAFKEAGAELIDIYWTLGQYDVVTIFEAPDSETAYRLLLAVGMQGNVRTLTMQAINEKEMVKVLGGLR